MSTPREEQPPARPASGPTVTTAPPRSRWNLSRVPAHVGPARTSTVVLALLFVGIFALYLAVRPPSATVATTGSTGGGVPTQVQQQTTTPTTSAPTTTRPPTPSRTSTAPSTAATSTGAATSSTAGETSGATSGSSGETTTVPSLPTTGSAPSS